jgi:hypothetical protein
MSDLQKITEQHRRRRAVVYVRQSTMTQVERNQSHARGSTRCGSARSSWGGRLRR